MTKFINCLTAIAVFLPLSVQQAAAASCGRRETMTKQLGTQFNEVRRGIGLASQANVVELYVSEQGNWSLIVTDTRGMSCIVGAGEAWQDHPRTLAGLDS